MNILNQTFDAQVYKAQHQDGKISIVDCFTQREVIQTYTGQPGTASILFVQDADTVTAFHGYSKERLFTCKAAAIEAMFVDVENGGTWNSMLTAMQRA